MLDITVHTADSVYSCYCAGMMHVGGSGRPKQCATSFCACAGLRSPQKENPTESDFFQTTAERLYPAGAAAWVDAGTMANTRIRQLGANQRLAVVLP
jgi:hypothetical protein